MIPMPSGVRVWLAAGHTDMRRGMQGLALQVQEQLKRDPHGGDLYLFRGRRGDLAKGSGTTASGYRAMRSGSTAGSSSGRRRRRASFRFWRGRWPTCSKESTGGIRN
jgi:transposase